MEDITICIAVVFTTEEFEENRDNIVHRISNALESYRKADPLRRFKLSVATMFDVDRCIGFLRENWVEHGRPLTVTLMRGGKYNNGVAKNESVASAHTDMIFTTDADTLMPEDFLEHYDRIVREDVLWFPISFTFLEGKKEVIHPDNGQWRTACWNSLGTFRDTYFRELGGWVTDYDCWAPDDRETFSKAMKLKRHGVRVVEEKLDGFVHPWHSRTSQWHKNGRLKGYNWVGGQ